MADSINEGRNGKRKARDSQGRFSAEGASNRAQIRRNLTELHTKLDRLDVRDGGCEKYGKLRDIRNESNKEISKGHVTPREMGIDAKLTMGMSKKFDLILDTLEAGSATSKRIDAEEFGHKLAHTMIEKTKWQEDLTKPGVDHWVQFGPIASQIFHRPANYLQNLGLLEHIREMEENGAAGLQKRVTPSPRKPKQTFQTQHKAPTRVRELKPKTVEDKESEDQNVRRRMEICRKALKKRITNVGNHPVHYLKFAADPDSFEATVRNLFTLSHLINRQEVSLVFDSLEQPYIYLQKGKENLVDHPDHPQLSVRDLHDEGTTEPLGNFITTITPDEWREILEVYQVKEPAIPQGIPSNDK